MPTVTADDRRHIVLPDAKPGERFDLSKDSHGRIVLRPLRPEPAEVGSEARVVSLKYDKRGMPYMPGIKMSRERVAELVREGRDSR